MKILLCIFSFLLSLSAAASQPPSSCFRTPMIPPLNHPTNPVNKPTNAFPPSFFSGNFSMYGPDRLDAEIANDAAKEFQALKLLLNLNLLWKDTEFNNRKLWLI